MEFLPEIERIKLQGLNHFCYDHAVSRARVNIKLPDEHLFAVVHQPKPNIFETKTLSYRCTGQVSFFTKSKETGSRSSKDDPGLKGAWVSCQVGLD